MGMTIIQNGSPVTLNVTRAGATGPPGADWNAAQVAEIIHAADEKLTIADADELGIADSESGWTLKKWAFATIKATLKTHFDTIYAAISATGGEVAAPLYLTTAPVDGTTDADDGQLVRVSAVSGVGPFTDYLCRRSGGVGTTSFQLVLAGAASTTTSNTWTESQHYEGPISFNAGTTYSYDLGQASLHRAALGVGTLYEVSTDADKRALTGLIKDDRVLVIDEGNRVELYIGGDATRNISWSEIDGGTSPQRVSSDLSEFRWLSDSLPWFGSFAFGSFAFPPFDNLGNFVELLDFSRVAHWHHGLSVDFSPCTLVTEVDFSSLVSVAGQIALNGNQLEELILPELVSMDYVGTIIVNTPTTISAPRLTGIEAYGGLYVSDNANLTTLNLPSLVTLSGSLYGGFCPALAVVDLSALEAIRENTGNLNLSFCGLISIEFPSLVGLEGSLNLSDNSLLTSVRMQAGPTGGYIDVSNCNLDAAALDQLFTDLGVTTTGVVTVLNNPGLDTCSSSIATTKGWTVNV